MADFGGDILIIVQPVDLEMIVSLDYSGLDLHLADSVTVTDDVLVSTLLEIVVEDVVVVTDDALVETVLTLDVADAVAVTDELVFANVFNLSFADDVLALDAPAIAAGGIVTAADDVTTDDLVAFDIRPVFAEFVFPTDDLQLGFVSTLPLADSVTVADDFGKALNKAVDDAVTATDAFSSGDQYWANVVLLLHGDGPNNAANNNYLDYGANNIVLTQGGTPLPYQGAVSPYAGSGGSAYIPAGSSGGVNVAASAANNLGTGDFTIEGWVRPTAFGASLGFVDQWTNGSVGSFTIGQYEVYITSGGAVQFIVATTASAYTTVVTSPAAITAGVWTHVAVVRASGTVTLYINGVAVASAAFSGQVGSAGAMLLGNQFNTGAVPLNGFVSDIRISANARYTANFTPPTSALSSDASTRLLAAFTNAAIVDTARKADYQTFGAAKLSSVQSKFGGVSMAFLNNSADFLQATPTSTEFVFGTGAFTIDFWVYPLANSSGVVVSNQPAAFSDNAWRVGFNGGKLYFATWNSTILQTATTLALNQWWHVEVSYDGSSYRIFLNGVGDASVTVAATNFSVNSPITVGRCNVSGSLQPLNGYVDDLRITKGVARHTANFTPPTEPVPNGPAGPVAANHYVSLTDPATTSSDSVVASKVYTLNANDSVTVSDSVLTSPTIFVTGGVLAAGTTIPVSSSGAAVGDLIVVFSCYGSHTLGGAGWTHEDITSGYSGRWSWKILDSTANITCTGNSYSFQWALYRGASNAARAATYGTNPTDNIPWPTPAANAVAQVLMTWAQSSTDQGAPSGFATRYENYVSVFRQECFDRFGAAAGLTPLTAASANALMLELRRVVTEMSLSDIVGVTDGAGLFWNGPNMTLPDEQVAVSDSATLVMGVTVNVLLIGGGGGGGGGGQVQQGTLILPNGTHTVTIGAGGAGGDGTSTSNWDGKPGNSSSIGALLTAIGGGGGGGNPGSIKGLDGASGGGSAGGTGAGIAFPGGASTIPGGFAGGNGNVGASAAGGGGGGAGQRGNDSTANGGNGGNGITSSISGAAVQYAGGGGGGIVSGQGSAGTGVYGGATGSTNTGTAASGTANRGGGGGGGGYNSGRGIGGAGGSGVCIISYPTGTPANISGGTITTSGGNTIHTFTSTASLTVGPAVITDLPLSDSVTATESFTMVGFTLDLLVVGGGGGGGASTAAGTGGGGGGGVISQTGLTPAIGSYTVTVGAAGLRGGGGNPLNGGDGGDSSALGFTAKGGGGGGGSARLSGANGGSGGGASTSGGSPGTGTAGQGTAGGSGGAAGGGGGGGATFAGSSAGGTGTGGPAGIGLNSSISGTSVGYGYGGGGGASSSGTGGGSGNGGANGGANGAAGGDAPANRGGGGGGAGQNAAGGAGGSGVVIFSYPTGSATCTGGTITTAGGRTIHTFTASGTFQRTA